MVLVLLLSTATFLMVDTGAAAARGFGDELPGQLEQQLPLLKILLQAGAWARSGAVVDAYATRRCKKRGDWCRANNCCPGLSCEPIIQPYYSCQ